MTTNSRKVEKILRSNFEKNLVIIKQGLDQGLIEYDKKNNSISPINQIEDDDFIDLRGGASLDTIATSIGYSVILGAATILGIGAYKLADKLKEAVTTSDEWDEYIDPDYDEESDVPSHRHLMERRPRKVPDHLKQHVSSYDVTHQELSEDGSHPSDSTDWNYDEPDTDVESENESDDDESDGKLKKNPKELDKTQKKITDIFKKK